MRLVYRYSALTLALALVTALVFETQLRLSWLVSWLIAISLVAFCTYAYDKSLASGDALRVPERVLLLLALIGGTPGAFLGMQVFRHKTSKQSFQQQFWLVVLVQIILIAAYLAVVRPHG